MTQAVYMSIDHFAHAPNYIEAMEKLRAMIAKAVSVRRGNQASDDQQVDEGYIISTVPCFDKATGARIGDSLNAWPAVVGPDAASILTVYYGPPPPGLRWREPNELRVVYDSSRRRSSSGA